MLFCSSFFPLYVSFLYVQSLLLFCFLLLFFFFFKQKTAYEMRISDWSSDVCSSDLVKDAGSTKRSCALRVWVGPRNRWVTSRGVVERLREIGRASCRERVCQYV